ncbi:hypothetical protein GCK72_001810 [Caenorhabditis remanei]|uniref:C2H2-type domain-containing protein n=1 Tax=Caenorhabditis remanei TaxID=31234 RepID=A0A6A5HUS4_CAERE|nr:hypothetical protein GCK72_001810 [Caenorhabditis remanei]KAF1769993.1 hypothetical protein GCK72_001810 [Caenorhabditis remanei]
MSLSDKERAQITAFYNKREEMKANNQLVLDCSKCLMMFDDVIIYRFHMSMHTPALPSSSIISSLFTSPATWQCSLCKRICLDRLDFQLHTIKYGHLLIPQGLMIPPALAYHNGLPDLASLCQPNDLLKELVNLVNNSSTNQQ